MFFGKLLPGFVTMFSHIYIYVLRKQLKRVNEMLPYRHTYLLSALLKLIKETHCFQL